MKARAAGLLLGFVADRVAGAPTRLHPVAGFGTIARRLENAVYGDSRARGVAHVALLVGGAAALGLAADRTVRGPVSRTAVTAAATWVVLGGHTLERAASAVHAQLVADDRAAARVQVRRLVGRDTDDLDASEVARAAIESVAENSSDAVVAPLVWGGLLGPAGLLGYRAANTLDAMIGHHNDRYERFGWAAARLDDVLNLPGSRLAGLLVLTTDPANARDARTAWRRDADRHPSPNAGVVESTFAGSLGIRLGGTNRYYGNRVEHRAVMGVGRAPRAADIPKATRLAARIGGGAALSAAAVALLRSTR